MDEIPLCLVKITHIPSQETTEIYYASLYSMKTRDFFFEESVFFEVMFSVNMTEPLYDIVLHTKNFFLDIFIVKASLSIITVSGDDIVLLPDVPYMSIPDDNDGIRFMIDLTRKNDEFENHVFSCGSVNSLIDLVIEVDARNISDMPCQLRSFMYENGYVLHT